MADSRADDDFLNWSSKLEDLIDDGDTHAAKRLLESIVAKLESRNDAPFNLTLAAALSDLGELYRNEGLAMKAESLFNSALLIKHRAEKMDSGDVCERIGSNCSDDEKAHSKTLGVVGELSTSRSNREEDWEIVFEDLSSSHGQLAATKISEMPLEEKRTPKQHGRGAFTFGEMGMYSDRMTRWPICNRDEQDAPAAERDVNGHSNFGAGHVLIVDGFSPKVTTKDLEDLFQPVASCEVAIRWVNDTTALAVFPNPMFAQEALQGMHNPHFKVHVFGEDDSLSGQFNERDLEPPIPRRATSSHAAHRMIVGALRSQGSGQSVHARSNFQDVQKQENERKQRLLMRHKLRDDAWGLDD